MDTNKTYYSNHFTIYVSQTILLCTLNFYSDTCKLYHYNTGGKSHQTMRYIHSCGRGGEEGIWERKGLKTITKF